MNRLLRTIAVLLLALPHLVAQETSFETDVRALTATPHRLTGTPEYSQAADYVRQRLVAIVGEANVLEQPFATVQTVIGECRLVAADGRALPLLPMRPNGIVPPNTPTGGLSGDLFYAGNGTLDAYGETDPDGKIVVLDYASGRHWLTAFELGAEAVIFLADPEAAAWHAHHVDANANLPRYYYNGPVSDLPVGQRVTLHASIRWEAVTGRNLYAWIPGDPGDAPGPLAKEALVIATRLDSFGEVPRLSPGARGAANAAALLQLAERLQSKRPKRHVLIAFFDAEARGHLGVGHFYRALEDKEKTILLATRRGNLNGEAVFLEGIIELVASEQPFDPRHAAFKELVRRLRPKADEHVFDLTHRLSLLRIAIENLPEGDPAAAAIQTEIEQLTAVKDIWNSARRAIAKDTFTAESIEGMLRHRQGEPTTDEQAAALRDRAAEVLAKLHLALGEVRADLLARQSELRGELATLAADEQLAAWLRDKQLVLHLSMLLGDSSRHWGLIVGGDSIFHSPNDQAGNYSRLRSALRETATTGQRPLPTFAIASVDDSIARSRQLVAMPFLVHSGEIAGCFGIYNAVLGTIQEAMPREGTPIDTVDRLNLEALAAQSRDVATLIGAFADHGSLSQGRNIVRNVRYVSPRVDKGRFQGAIAMGKSRGSSMPNKPLSGVIIQIGKYQAPSATFPYTYQPVKPYAFDSFQVIRSNQEGAYAYGPICLGPGNVAAFGIRFADEYQPQYASVTTSQVKSDERLNLVIARHGAIGLPLQFQPAAAKVMNGITNSPLDAGRSYQVTHDGVACWYTEDDGQKDNRIKLFGLGATVALANGQPALSQGLDESALAPEEALTGVGLSMDPHWSFPPAARMAATDLWRLNEARLDMLRSRGVTNSSVEELHGRAEDLLLAASAAGPLKERQARTSFAFLAQRPIYTAIRTTLNDLVHAVLVLLALAVPFAFALERLLIGSATIYKQISWFTAFFLVPFVILYFTHPAFAISKTPVVIFLGFAIIILAGLVIFIIMRKFEVELKIVQGLESTVHAADVSRFGTVMAAMSMGISSMRRRPLRTALTAITIILLTFTILCFASFGSQLGIVKLAPHPSPGYTGVNLHDVNWAALDTRLLPFIEGRWPGQTVLTPRYWVAPHGADDPGPLVTAPGTERHVGLRGILALAAAEAERRDDLAALLGTTDPVAFADGVWLTEAVANQLGIAPGAPVILAGQRFRLIGTLDPIKLAVIRDMDGSDLVPVDFTQITSVQSQAQDSADAVVEQSWSTLPVDSVAIVGANLAPAIGAELHAINLYTDNVQQAVEIAEGLSRVLPMPVNGTRADGVYRHVLGQQMAASGAADLIFPILLGSLVIFGTMLGSVADREKEIYTFSALGLAPQHVAGLFFAEALVYALIGGLGGYLLAQGAFKLLGYLATFGLVRVPEMNYSSMNAIVTILLVMGTVLISAIYPAIQASRSANPGVMRAWKLPAPEGDRWHIVFPFTVSGYDITGVVAFLKEHFDAFSDTGLGRFMASETRLTKAGEQVGVEARLALAPFDLGVTQDFALRSAPSEIPGIDEIRIELVRQSGQPKDWYRLNKGMLEDLRRQFLIWRSLPPDTMEMYRQRTLAALGPATPAAQSTDDQVTANG